MTREELITQINSGDFTLSFSAIKEFAKSPSHFINYKLGDKKETPAMKKGTLIHCAILEPQELEKRYCILNRSDLPNPEMDFRNTENKEFKKKFEAQAELSGKEIIDPIEWEEAIKHRDLAYNNEIVSPYLKNLKHTEFKTSWDFGGYKWRGIIDGLSSSYVLDLKTVADASPDRLKYLCIGEKYHWQQFLYRQSERVIFYFNAFNLLVDGNYGISLLKITEDQLFLAQSELEKMLEKFKICLDNNLWHMNYEFWSNNQEKGYFTIN